MPLPKKPPISHPVPNNPFKGSENPFAEATSPPHANLEAPIEETSMAEQLPTEGKHTDRRRRRAKDTEGKFIGDNPLTPENEAWEYFTE